MVLVVVALIRLSCARVFFAGRRVSSTSAAWLGLVCVCVFVFFVFWGPLFQPAFEQRRCVWGSVVPLYHTRNIRPEKTAI